MRRSLKPSKTMLPGKEKVVFTYFLPKDSIPYNTPVPNIKPHPKILARPGSSIIGGIAAL